jgi:[ribosomal protein S5]-alanine N-acetyltransferase
MNIGKNTTSGPIFINGKSINLSPLDPEGDLSDYLLWMNDQKITQFMETGSFATTRRSLEEYIHKYNASKNLLLGIYPSEVECHIGNITLHMIDYQNRSAEIGIVIGDEASQGKGYAFEAIRLVLNHAFMRLNLHKVCTGMVAANVGSKKVFEKAGFILEGTLRKQFFSKGKYLDCYKYGILEEEYFESLKNEE